MSKFTFRLDSVLRLRIHAEQSEQRAVANAQLTLQGLQEQLHAMESRIVSSSAQLRKHIGGREPDARWLLQHAHFAQDLRTQATALSDQVFQAGLALATAQEILVVASAQRKSLEKLKHRQREQHAATEDKHERNVHDEIAARLGR